MCYRSLEVNVINNTHNDFYLKSIHLDCGLWVCKPDNIPDNESGSFMVKDYEGIYGIEGYVKWVRHRDHNEFEIAFEKPAGGEPTDFLVTCSDDYRYVISGDPLQPHAVVTVTFYREDPI